MTHHDDPDSDIARLISAAGTRTAPAADRAARVRAATEAAWRAEVRRRRQRSMIWIGGALLASAAALFLAVQQRSTVAPAAVVPVPATIARLAAANGEVRTGRTGAAAVVAAVGHAIAAGSNIQTGAASRAALTLSDGGEMRLDTDTDATLVDARTIQIARGAIYLDSGVSTPGRFTVRTTSGTLRDIGTRFEVRVAGRDVVVRVRDGAVQLEQTNRIERVPMGTELTAHADGAISTRGIDAFAADWAWTTEAAPPFTVEGATLESFLQWATHEGGWTLEWSDAMRQRARTTTLHGTIAGMTPAEALSVVLPTCGLSPVIARGTLRLRPLQGAR